ncbi:MAG: membrane dipeptidase [Acidobacteria bacterium]|nr:MAG: membrane dipeptidase [Acidobacteriota bacterium]
MFAGAFALLLAGVWACVHPRGDAGEAVRIAHAVPIVDTHIDLPYRLYRKPEDISRRTPSGDFDYVRAREGGLDAAFMSIYVPARYQESGGARRLADELIDIVEGIAAQHPDKFALAASAEDVERNFRQGRFSLLLGMENGAGIEGDIGNLTHFYERGIRYITLAHSRNNLIADSSYDEQPRWHGLSPFGEEVVREMNRLGILIDVSHLTDDAARRVLEISRAPVIASHSSCRRFTPGWQRNLSDELIRGIARSGGVVQINFGSSFLDDGIRRRQESLRKALEAWRVERGLSRDDPEFREHAAAYRKAHHPGYADVADVADHIDHVVSLVGVDHVGFGSDFDGVGDSLPRGLEDVSRYPNLIRVLLERGYGEDEIRKIAGGNILRVMRRAAEVARDLQQSQ